MTTKILVVVLNMKSNILRLLFTFLWFKKHLYCLHCSVQFEAL